MLRLFTGSKKLLISTLAAILICFVGTAYYMAEAQQNSDIGPTVNAEMAELLNAPGDKKPIRRSDTSLTAVRSDADSSRPQSAKPQMESRATKPIDLNEATLEQLDTLPGIGKSKAQAIIDYRTEHGPYRSKEELLQVKGIGPKTLERLSELIAIFPAVS